MAETEPVPLTEEVKEVMRSFDLASTHAKYLDGHMMIYLIRHLQAISLYPEKQMQEAEIQILQRTNMVDETEAKYMDYKGLTEKEIPKSFSEQRTKLVTRINQLSAECEVIVTNFSAETDEGWQAYLDLSQQVDEQTKKSLFNIEYLNAEMGITREQFESLYSLAKIKYETGDYASAGAYLAYYRKIGDLNHDSDAKWGKYASELLVHDWPQALDSLKVLQEGIESTAMNPSVYTTEGAQLQARAWLMHWSLFLFYFQAAEVDDEARFIDDGLDKLVESWLPDLYKSPASSEKENRQQWKYLRVIQTICPHLLRYIAAAVVIGSEESGKRASGAESGHIRMKQKFRDLTKLVDSEKRYYKDPVTEFVYKLFTDCDLEGAQKKLEECEHVMDADFFLAHHKGRFVKQARKMIFENHCRIHSVMDIGMVAKRLNTDNIEAERYIVKMIRGAQLDAKIDSEANQVLLASPGNSVYRTVRERTKLIRDKTDQLIERLQDRRPQREEEERARAAKESSDVPPRDPPPMREQYQQRREEKPSGPRSTMRDFVRA